MKILLLGKNSQKLENLLKNLRFEIVNQSPEVIISYGGDGTLLSSERTHPGIPKLPIRDSLICKKCPEHSEEVLLKKLLQGKLELKTYSKLETEVENQSLVALNDFVIRNKAPMHSIRFKIEASELLIGDGVVISTPFGSSGYFKSITQKTFGKGFGLAFNNTTEQLEPQFFNNNDQVAFKLIRGNATLSFDNNQDIFTISEGSKLTFKISDQVANIYEADALRCPNCHINRG